MPTNLPTQPQRQSQGTQNPQGQNQSPLKNPPEATTKESNMNQDQLKGKFDQMKGKIKEAWGRLSDDDIALYNGKRDQLVGKIQETYGVQKEQAENRLRELEKVCNVSSASDEAA